MTAVAVAHVGAAFAADAPGGFLEDATSAAVRPRLTPSQIQAMLPARGPFRFPDPYATEGIRVTNASDCGGGDCVLPVGYSYWRNINAHAGDGSLFIFLGLSRASGGGGPTLFRYDKASGAVTNLGPLFDPSSRFSWRSTEGWYWSATRPKVLYVDDGAKLLRYDVDTRQFETVFDAAQRYGADKSIWQTHTSDDDRVHSATLRNTATSEMLGCLVYDEGRAAYSYFPKQGDFDECQVDKSGRWLLILENVDGLFHEDNRIIDLTTGEERLLLDEAGAAGHHDLGYGYMVNEDDWAPLPGSAKVWRYDRPLVPGLDQDVLVYHLTSWAIDIGHIAHGNAKPGVPMDRQYVCSSNASRLDLPRANEIVCYRPDGSLDVLVVAPVMTDLDASGGGADDYSKRPKGNIDVTGEYFVWTSNAGGGRLDAFVVRVPGQKLVPSGSDTTPPTVSLTSPGDGEVVGGTVEVVAAASDDVGVVGVRFVLDGADLGAEDLAAPYSILWDTTDDADGPHTLEAVARDAAGNTSRSSPVVVTVDNGAPGEVQDLRFSGDSRTLVWAPDASGGSAGSTRYDTIRSDDRADFGSAAVCVESDDGADTSAADPEAPAPGAVFYYLIRAENDGGQGTLGTRSDGVERTGRSCGPTGPAVQSVVWTESVNCAVTGGSLEKVSGVDGLDDAGAVSEQQIVSGEGYVEFRATETGALRYAGLTHGSSGTSAAEIDFAIRLQSGIAEVRENGTYRADTPFASGDAFRVSVSGGVVSYAKNGATFYTSATGATYPLVADASIVSLGGTVTDAVIATGP